MHSPLRAAGRVERGRGGAQARRYGEARVQEAHPECDRRCDRDRGVDGVKVLAKRRCERTTRAVTAVVAGGGVYVYA